MRRAIVAILCLSAAVRAAAFEYCSGGKVSQSEVAQAIQNSPTVPQSIKNAACGYAAMAAIESGDGTTADLCNANDCCTGVLQLNGRGVTEAKFPGKADYAKAGLQAQVDGWGSTAASNMNSAGYKTLNAAYQSGQTIGGQTVTPGMLAACEQFGAGQCNQNVAAMRNGTGCGAGVNGNPTICQWGRRADRVAEKGNCSTTGNCSPAGGPQGDFPLTAPSTDTELV